MTALQTPRISLKKRGNKDSGLGWTLVTPVLIILAVVIGYPTFASIWFSFTNRTVGGDAGEFVGLDNYTRLIGDAAFQSALWNLIFIVAFALVLKLVIGLATAVLLNQPIRGRKMWRALAILPWAIPGFVAFMAWKLMYEPDSGALNQVIFGLTGQEIGFLTDPVWSRISVAFATFWRGFPFWTISFLAALQTIPKELYEAAEMDGASPWKSFWHITLPSLRPTIILVSVLSTIWTANSFENVWLLTQGGPSNATMTFPVLSYLSLQNLRIGDAAAAAVVILPVFIVLLVFLIRSTRKGSNQ
jgi:ABC-type sugar transport system permease subunit